VLQDASVIQLLSGPVFEGFIATAPYSVTIKGGFDPLFTASGGTSYISGAVRLRSGKTVFEKVLLR
jgi:hypothetical protein